MTATVSSERAADASARRGQSMNARLRATWFQVHLWIGVALSLLFIPIGLSGAVMVWPELLSPPPAVTGSATLPIATYLEAAQTALGDKAAPYQLRLPTEANQPVTVMARPVSRDHHGGPEGGGRQTSGGQPGASNDTQRGERHGGGHHHDAAAGADAVAPAASVPAAPTANADAPAPRADASPPGAQPARGGPRARPITVLLNPGDARVISVGTAGKGALWVWLHTFHERLFIDGWGRSAVGWLGVAMLISALTGLWLWWPRAGSPLSALRWRRTPGTLLNLHYTTGFWICLPLALLALTGAALGFPQTSRSLIGNFAPVTQQGPGGPGGGGQRPLGHPNLTPDAAVAAARTLRPSGGVTALTMPTRAQPVWKVEFADAAQPVQIDDASAKATLVPAQPGGDVFWRWVHRIHGGDDMPVLWKLILTLAGFAPTLLGVTGVIVWIAKSRRKATQKVRARA